MDDNLRRGNAHEQLGLCLLHGIAAVAPVPRTQDVGLDAVATLLRRSSGRRLLAGASFYVQLKAGSVRKLVYKDDEIDWLKLLGLPLFIGCVDGAKSRMDLYATHALQRVMAEGPAPRELHLYLDPINAFLLLQEGAARPVNIGPPVMTWTAAEITEPDLVDRAHEILRDHVETDSRNRRHQAFRYVESLKWSTNHPPAPGGTMIAGHSTEARLTKEILDTLNPGLLALGMDRSAKGDPEGVTLVLNLIQHLKANGVGIDSENELSKILNAFLVMGSSDVGFGLNKGDSGPST